MICGIYKITENETGRCYIGQSKNVEARWRCHRKRFSPDLHTYEIIMECDAEQLSFWEIAWIASERSIEFGFNKTIGGTSLSSITGRKPFLGKKHTEETKAKCAKANKGIAKTKVECPHCCKVVSCNTVKRYHFDNCKEKR